MKPLIVIFLLLLAINSNAQRTAWLSFSSGEGVELHGALKSGRFHKGEMIGLIQFPVSNVDRVVIFHENKVFKAFRIDSQGIVFLKHPQSIRRISSMKLTIVIRDSNNKRYSSEITVYTDRMHKGELLISQGKWKLISNINQSIY